MRNLSPDLKIFGCKPATDAFVLQVGVKTFGKFMIFGRVTDKTSIKLDGATE
jgi:hypothetical protein